MPDDKRDINNETLIPGIQEDLMANGALITSVLLGFLKDLGRVIHHPNSRFNA